MDEKIVLQCTVENIIYRNEKNGYTVCEMNSDDDDFVAVGVLPHIQEGEQMELSGCYTTHPEYGQQFKIEEYIRKSFTTKEAIERYISSGILRGIGIKLAKKIVAKFGMDTLEIIKNTPCKLTEIKGIKEEKAIEYSVILHNKENIQNLILFLSAFDIGQSTCIRIEKHFGDTALAKIKENPYCLSQIGLGIDFMKSDQIALSLGFDLSSALRVQSAMITVLYIALYNGNTYLNLEVLLNETSKLIDNKINRDEASFESLMTDERIIYFIDLNIVALKIAFNTENSISKSIKIRARTDDEKDCKSIKKTHLKRTDDISIVRENVLNICGQQSINYDDDQINSICECLCNPITIITGGPGTGKTTIISLLCQYMKKKGKIVSLAAPTGRAAKRMQETTNSDSKTIHRLLEVQYRPDVDDFNLIFARNSDNPIEADLIIIDEASMLDIFLMNHLMNAVPPDCLLVFVGDENQLPSVGAGNVLKDMIASKIIPVVELKKVYRQETGSLIVQNSHDILHGKYPTFDQKIDSEFMFISKYSDEDKLQSILSLCTKVLKQHYHADIIRDVQILTPTRKGLCGTKELNSFLQKALNDSAVNHIPDMTKSIIKKQSTNLLNTYKINDKVMQTRNNYEIKWISIKDSKVTGNGVFNGDMGIVVLIGSNCESIHVLFDEEKIVEYNNTNIEEIELAYAITVHKSQGSEYPIVVLVLPHAPDILMTRNLLYTALSRAKEKLFLVTEKNILMKMISNTSITRRNTLLEKLLTDNIKAN